MIVAFIRAYFAPFAAVALLILGSTAKGATPTLSSAPNILLIMVDDLGINDLGMNNPEMRTPNIDALAAEGTNFTRHYTDATCSPTRVGLLTGLAPARLGFRPVQQGISTDVTTLPKVLSSAGYNTYHLGKWHVGNSIPELSPKEAGFHHWYGFLTQSVLAGPSRDGIHFKWPRYQDPWMQTETLPPARTAGHLTDIITHKTLETLRELSSSSKPWFLNLWYYAPHAPIEPAARFAKKYPDSKQGAYRALVEQLDTSVGKILTVLQKLGLADNTLVIFMSDNGGTNFVLDNNHPFPGRKGDFLEGGLRTPMFWRWPARLPAGQVVDDIVSYLDILPTLAHITGRDLDLADLDLAGEDLWPSIQGDAPYPERNLYWEYQSYSHHTYSVLDKGGRFRLNSHKGVKALRDATRPLANPRDLAIENPRIIARLEKAFSRWRQHQNEISIELVTINDDGAAIASGDGVQRSPGYGGFTFGIGVTPKAATPGQNPTPYIAYQREYWGLSLNPKHALILSMLGERLQGPPLKAGKCTSVIVSSYHHFSLRSPQNNKAMINLYVDGTRVDHTVRKNPAVAPASFSQPTFIGFKSNSKRPARLKLTAPRFYNEMFVPGDASGLASNTIEGLSSALCAKANEG